MKHLFFRKSFGLIFALCSIFVMSGCAMPKDKDFESVEIPARENMEKFDVQAKPVAIMNESYLGASNIVPFAPQVKNPSYLAKTLTLIEANLPLDTLTQRLTSLLNVPVSVAPMPKGGGRGGVGAGAMSVNYTGDVRTLLDMVASKFNVQWEVDETGGVTFYKVKTQVYTVLANIGINSAEASISNKSDSGGGGDGGGGGESSVLGEQSISYKSNIDVWNETLKTVESMLSEYGSVAPNQSAGAIIVSDVPLTLQRIEKYIKEVNRRLSRQVAITVSVFTVSRNQNSAFDFSLDMVLKNAGLLISSSGGSVGGAAQDAANIIIGADADSDTSFGRKFGGSQLVFNALNKWGRTALLHSQKTISMHQQTTPIQVVTSKTYLASSTNSQTASVGSTTTLEPGQVTTGFSILLTPNILTDNNLILQYQMALSTLDKIEEKESNSSTIQMPEVSSRAFAQRVSMRMGQSLVLSGFAADSNMGDEGYGILSYGKGGSKGRETIVIVIDVDSLEGASYEPFSGI